MKVDGEVRKTMRPGEKGTYRFVRDWGERLVCVRYRFDAKGRVRYTTIEVVASDPRPWSPPRRPAPSTWVALRIDRDDWKSLRKLRGVRAWWDKETGCWRTRYDVAERLRLRNRIVDLRQTPRSAHRPMATNRNPSENPLKSS